MNELPNTKFYLMRGHAKQNRAPIYCRVSVNGTQATFTTKILIPMTDWIVGRGRVAETGKDNAHINKRLDVIESMVRSYCVTLRSNGCEINALNIVRFFRQPQRVVLHTFSKTTEEFIKRYKVRVGSQIKLDTCRRYIRTYDLFRAYLRASTGRGDVLISQVRPAMLSGFYDYLRDKWAMQNNGAVQHLERLHTIFLVARSEGYTTNDPFVQLHYHRIPTDRGFLTKAELQCVTATKMPTERLEQLRDAFVFSCFTGMAYVDIKNLTGSSVSFDANNELWLCYKRQKTTVTARIQLLNIAKRIIWKYYRTDKPTLFNLPDNAVANKQLRKVMEICGIERHVTYHQSRHTFATTVTLSNGVPIETVSKMLGHTNINTTQIYARITDTKISDDMHRLADRIGDDYELE